MEEGLSRLHVHQAPAQPAQGKREGHEPLQGRDTAHHLTDPRGHAEDGRLTLPNRRIGDPYVRWCGRRGAVSPPIPLGPKGNEKHSNKKIVVTKVY
jgi:hypothetical protein